MGAKERRAEQKAAIVKSLEAGQTIVKAAEAAGCHRRTVYTWLVVDPEFKLAVDVAMTSRVRIVEDALYVKAVGGHVTAQIFWLINRSDRWRDVRHVQVEAVLQQGPDLAHLLAEIPGQELIETECKELPGVTESAQEPPVATEVVEPTDTPLPIIEATDGNDAAPTGKYAVGDKVKAIGAEAMSPTFGLGKVLTVKAVHEDEGAGVEYTVSSGAETARIRERGLAAVELGGTEE